MTPSPAAIRYLTEINETIGAQWALRLAREMREGFIQSIDGEPVFAKVPATKPVQNMQRHVQGVLTNETR